MAKNEGVLAAYQKRICPGSMVTSWPERATQSRTVPSRDEIRVQNLRSIKPALGDILHFGTMVDRLTGKLASWTVARIKNFNGRNLPLLS